MAMASRNYYKAQVVGWSVYTMISAVVFILSGRELNIDSIGGIYLAFALGLVTSHLYRAFIVKMGWLVLDIFGIVPRVLAACAVLAVGFHLLYIAIGNLAFGWQMKYRWDDPNIFAWAMLFFIWNLLYFAYIFFLRYRTEEIKNLKLEAARNEYELRRLRDQMNPHFIFNAMNTIRALIDEDPKKAKNAVTQLSNVLRSSLQTGKQDLISLEKELQIVSDYLEIEKARYEERLQTVIDIEPEAMQAQIPPLMLQTIVENCIKHGIAKLPKGGAIEINARQSNGHVDIHVTNPGQYSPSAELDASLGLENTRNRLDLSFGKNAWMTIGNLDNKTVRTNIRIPMKRLGIGDYN